MHDWIKTSSPGILTVRYLYYMLHCSCSLQAIDRCLTFLTNGLKFWRSLGQFHIGMYGKLVSLLFDKMSWTFRGPAKHCMLILNILETATKINSYSIYVRYNNPSNIYSVYAWDNSWNKQSYPIYYTLILLWLQQSFTYISHNIYLGSPEYDNDIVGC